MRILFIRGGALGDFILTLPTLRLLREKFPGAHLELLGHPALAEIALRRGYLDAVRSVNHGPLSAFFTPRAVLDPAWMDYIAGFDLVLSFFYDPDGLFLTNLQRCGPGEVLTLPPRVPENFGRPAAHYFARIVEPLGLRLEENGAASELFPTPDDLAAAHSFLGGLPPGTRLAALHPSSGGEDKNAPLETWADLGHELVRRHPQARLLLMEGEADAVRAQRLAESWKDLPLLRARLLPLPILAAVLREAAFFIGHDSGITHLAAAASRDLPVVTLFGPTDPHVWAPPRQGVRVLRSATGWPSAAEIVASLPL